MFRMVFFDFFVFLFWRVPLFFVQPKIVKGHFYQNIIHYFLRQGSLEFRFSHIGLQSVKIVSTRILKSGNHNVSVFDCVIKKTLRFLGTKDIRVRCIYSDTSVLKGYFCISPNEAQRKRFQDRKIEKIGRS